MKSWVINPKFKIAMLQNPSIRFPNVYQPLENFPCNAPVIAALLKTVWPNTKFICHENKNAEGMFL